MLLQIIEEDFYGAESIDNPIEILNYFFLIKTKRMKIQSIYEDVLLNCRIAAIKGNLMQCEILNLIDHKSIRAIHFTFELHNSYCFCETVIVSRERNFFNILIPQKIYFLRRRKYPRQRFDDMFMRFIILYSPLFSTREAEQQLENKYGHFIAEITNDSPSISILFQMLMTEIKAVSKDFHFKIFNKENAEELNLFEKTIVEQKKTLLIEDTAKMDSYILKNENSNLTNLFWYFEKLQTEQDEMKALLEIEKIKKEDSRNFLVSYIMAPIRIFEKVIGYFHISTNQFDKYFLSPYQAQELHTIFELFSYAITKIKIRQSHFEVNSMETRIINISVSGLLMEIQDETLYKYLHHHKRLKMLISVGGRELEIYGEIKRYFQRDSAYYMGILFFKTYPDDWKILERHLNYNKRYIFF